jgi:hypothetical protein
MGEVSTPRRTLALPRALERLLDELVVVARVDPAAVFAEARKRGIPVSGDDTVAQIASLRRCHPTVLDPLAASYVSGSALGAGVQGFVTNLGGAITLPIAIPADTVGTLAWIVRATSGVMNAYGFDTETEQGAAQLRLGLLVAAGVNSLTLDGGGRVVVRELSRQLLRGAPGNPIGVAVARRLAERFGTRAAARRLSRAVPLVGGVVGAGLNVTMVRVMANRTRAHYRQLLVDWQANQGRYGDGLDVVIDL